MKKSEIMVSIIKKLRGKQNAYTVEQITQCFDPTLLKEVKDAVFSLKEIGVLTQITDVTRDGNDITGIQYYYSLSPFYKQHLQHAAQTESIVECYATLFPDAGKEMVQAELFTN